MKKDEINCSLLIPGLLDLSAAECKAAFDGMGHLPELELFFARAEQTSFGRAGLEATLFELFDVPVETHRDLPVAAVSYRADSQASAPGWCLRADPVHLVPDRDQLVLIGPEALSLSAAEVETFTRELNAFFAEDGWHIEAPVPHRWYLHATESPELRTYELAQVRGQAIGNFLPAGAHGKHWQRIMNEIQMLLHTSSVNQQRQAAGKLTVSSLWFWGGGELSGVEDNNLRRKKESCWSGVWTNEAVGAGLAQLTGIPEFKLPENAHEWLSSELIAGEHLLVLDDLQQQWYHHGEAAWQQAVHTLQTEWIAPLLAALRDKAISSLTIYTGAGKCFTLTRRTMKRWWRRRRLLSQLCQKTLL